MRVPKWPPSGGFSGPMRCCSPALNFDLIVTLAPEAHHKALELTRTIAADVEYWPTPDPSVVAGSREQQLDAYRDLRDQLFERIKKRFDWHAGANE